MEGDPRLLILPDKDRQWSASHLSGLAASQEADGPSDLADQMLSQDIFRVARFLSKYCAERFTQGLVWIGGASISSP